ncbi:hypothetical protein K491DRAFT_718716 [Lophiostoma macrostomum CBS 122681]|uniref:Uncharacterized protein n=1 Tax=Lophiostoma macrostomum CBS 122681 TaxID=1314788 RepID=A0A6A6SYB4_9PLEO|nr:hypothetical protein K491DRAFT_718716 [Lophiostoma macrostomum CBS 122681]
MGKRKRSDEQAANRIKPKTKVSHHISWADEIVAALIASYQKSFESGEGVGSFITDAMCNQMNSKFGTDKFTVEKIRTKWNKLRFNLSPQGTIQGCMRSLDIGDFSKVIKKNAQACLDEAFVAEGLQPMFTADTRDPVNRVHDGATPAPHDSPEIPSIATELSHETENNVVSHGRPLSMDLYHDLRESRNRRDLATAENDKLVDEKLRAKSNITEQQLEQLRGEKPSLSEELAKVKEDKTDLEGRIQEVKEESEALRENLCQEKENLIQTVAGLKSGKQSDLEKKENLIQTVAGLKSAKQSDLEMISALQKELSIKNNEHMASIAALNEQKVKAAEQMRQEKEHSAMKIGELEHIHARSLEEQKTQAEEALHAQTHHYLQVVGDLDRSLNEQIQEKKRGKSLPKSGTSNWESNQSETNRQVCSHMEIQIRQNKRQIRELESDIEKQKKTDDKLRRQLQSRERELKSYYLCGQLRMMSGEPELVGPN